MRIVAIVFCALCLVGCASPMSLEARGLDVRRDDGSAIRAYEVIDPSVPTASRDAVALCVMPDGANPLDRLEDLAGACAAGSTLLLVEPDDAGDQARVLDRYLAQVHASPRTVVIIGLDAGSNAAIALANADRRVTHVALLGPPDTFDMHTIDERVPAFVGLIGRANTSATKRNIMVRSYPPADEKWREHGTGRTIRPLIEMDLIVWLTDTGALTSEHAKKLAKRVRDNHREWYGHSAK